MQTMAQVCPECHTVCRVGIDRCAACGSRLAGGELYRRWEQRIFPYVIIALLSGMIAAGLWYLLDARRG